MFVSPVDKEQNPDRKAWDNLTIYDNGRFYAFFNAMIKREDDRPERPPVSMDIAESKDGVHWRFIGRDINPIPGALAGYGVFRVGDSVMYYPTCTNKEKGIHFKVYRSKDLLHWEHLGDEYDVLPDPKWYRARWDEVYILKEQENGRDLYIGYISAEVRDDVGAPSVGMMKSYDGIRWEVLPPPVIEWGELPSHHMELNFCEKIDGRYYLSASGRLYLDSYGYSLFTFVGDSPYGPFKPDLQAFRLCGTTRHDTTWLGHAIPTPYGLLVALWLSYQKGRDIPSDNFAVGPLLRLACKDGHLRLKYWQQNEAAKGQAIPVVSDRLAWVHPAEKVKLERDTLTATAGRIELSASRDGSIVMIDHAFDRKTGFVLEGFLTVRENRGRIETHQHAAGAGFYLESAPGEGRAIIPDTLGVTRTGWIAYADHRITDDDIYADAGKGLVLGRSGPLQGTLSFTCEDTVGPFGHASYCGIRHGRRHHFRFIARGDFFQLYIDDYYVQTYRMPELFSARVGLAAFDGICAFENLQAWNIDL